MGEPGEHRRIQEELGGPMRNQEEPEGARATSGGAGRSRGGSPQPPWRSGQGWAPPLWPDRGQRLAVVVRSLASLTA